MKTHAENNEFRLRAPSQPELKQQKWNLFTAQAGVAYAAEWQTNLTVANPVTFTNIAVTVDTRTVQANDPAAQTNGPARFYRLRIPTQP